MMPNGVSTEMSIELDLDIEQVKEKVVEFVRYVYVFRLFHLPTSFAYFLISIFFILIRDSDLPLRGKLEADWRRYCISYVTQEGFRYDLCKII